MTTIIEEAVVHWLSEMSREDPEALRRVAADAMVRVASIEADVEVDLDLPTGSGNRRSYIEKLRMRLTIDDRGTPRAEVFDYTAVKFFTGADPS